MKDRLIALDVFRGLTVLLMILVNNPGSWSFIYPPFKHAEWHGCTLTDLVFPFFMFIVGVSLAFSLRKFKLPSNPFLLKAIKRGLIIFLIDYLMRMYPFTEIDFSKTRIMGVLQRIGLAYIFASVLINFLKSKQLIFIGISILFGYWALLYFNSSDPYSLADSFVRRFDLSILGDKKMWHGKGIAFDPEGLLSTLPSIVTIIIGYFTGLEIIRNKDLKNLISKLLIYGIIAIGIGWTWGIFFPLNKPLWTSSYVIYTAGFALVTLSLLIYLIDVLNFKNWTNIFVAVGTNPLFIFVLSGLFAKTLYRINWGGINSKTAIYNYLTSIVGEINGSLLYALINVALMSLIAWIMYKKKIFITV